MEYKSAFIEIARLSGKSGYLLVDDLYHIRTSDQANVIDYLHRICKGTDIWLKIGTIRHRTKYYLPGDPPIGVKIGDDADDIDLDVTLEKYLTTKAFLFRILDKFAQECSVRLSDILTDGARDRLIIASGGVARDFLTLFRRSIEIARERWAAGDRARGSKIGAEDVNKAAGENDTYKKEEFHEDAESDEQEQLLSALDRIVDFCVEKNKSNCFLVEKDMPSAQVENIAELVDLKFVHHCSSRVTVRNKKGRIYDAYMLDISQYTGERARKNFEIIDFWAKDGAEKLRKSKLIYAEKQP
jgi:hypothetical protein